LLFMIWPFFPHSQELGTLAWIGGAVAFAVYLMTLRKTSGGIAYDFLRRLARAQRGREAVPQPCSGSCCTSWRSSSCGSTSRARHAWHLCRRNVYNRPVMIDFAIVESCIFDVPS